MIQVSRPTEPNVEQGNKILHIEAHDMRQEEYLGLKEVFGSKVTIRPFKGKKSLLAAAEAFHETEPNYYFIVDRDRTPDDKLIKIWSKFPERSHVLMWRKREFENYLLHPEWIHAGLQKLKDEGSISTLPTLNRIKASILRYAQYRLLPEIGHDTLCQCNEAFKLDSPGFREFEECETLEVLKDTLDFTTRAMLKTVPKLKAQFTEKVEDVFHKTLECYVGKSIEEIPADSYVPLKWGKGDWVNRLSGKQLWNGLMSELRIIPEDCSLLLAFMFQMKEFYPPDFVEVQRLLHA